MVVKTRKALYKYSPFLLSLVINITLVAKLSFIISIKVWAYKIHFYQSSSTNTRHIQLNHPTNHAPNRVLKSMYLLVHVACLKVNKVMLTERKRQSSTVKPVQHPHATVHLLKRI